MLILILIWKILRVQSLQFQSAGLVLYRNNHSNGWISPGALRIFNPATAMGRTAVEVVHRPRAQTPLLWCFLAVGLSYLTFFTATAVTIICITMSSCHTSYSDPLQRAVLVHPIRRFSPMAVWR